MTFTDALALRQSNRAFQDKQISEEQLAALISAANAAPTCMGRFERVHLTVVQDPEILKKLNAAFAAAVGNPDAVPTYGAPTLIYVSNSLEDEEIIYGANAGVIMENMLLAAADQGLASVYLFGVSQALLQNSEIPALLGLPEDFRTVSAIAVGYPAEPLQPRADQTGKIGCNRV